MTAFCWEREYIPYLRRRGFSSVYYLPLATDPQRFFPSGSATPYITYGFAGSSMGGKFLSDIAAKFIWKEKYRQVAEDVAACFQQIPFGRLDEYIEEACRLKSVPLQENDEHTKTWLRSYIIHTASMQKRKKCISSMMELGVEIFGDQEGWSKLFGGNGLKIHPDIDYYTQLSGCYQSVIVNVNITSCQMPTGLNQRVFDAPACGTFILNDYQKDLEELFSGSEYAAYCSPEELPEKADFYLKNEKARMGVVEEARRRILNEHTYLHRLKTLINHI